MKMESLGFNHVTSHLLNEDNIDEFVKKNKIGNYALGYLREGGFIPKYIGRSDNDLNSRLKDHLTESYKRFKFMYQSSARNAFYKECENYHDFKKQLNNKIHPARPVGTNWKCPRNCSEDY